MAPRTEASEASSSRRGALCFGGGPWRAELSCPPTCGGSAPLGEESFEKEVERLEMGNEPRWRRLLRDGQLQDDSPPCRNETAEMSHTFPSIPPPSPGVPILPLHRPGWHGARGPRPPCACAAVLEQEERQTHPKPTLSPPPLTPRAPQQPRWVDTSEVPVPTIPTPINAPPASSIPGRLQHPQSAHPPPKNSRDQHCTERGNPSVSQGGPRASPLHPHPAPIWHPPPHQGSPLPGDAAGPRAAAPAAITSEGPAAPARGREGSPGTGQLPKPDGRRGPPSARASRPGGEGKAGTEERLWFRRAR